ncbi:polysaccharide export protein EpsE [Roseateles saccharophilus]|uniref:Polysaccharide export outer membrane protein n=1 Tax=Roseateles saccharophilus TaxID=304 RepID=A0A4R3USS9_ROSSA|nr:polysaccharide export protein EpsE [Roseateles saccharophilus]MDG0833439.1 polysaccharide export protein EpsE [Roseateles saccharophilus]TCU93094.1 polysaccharide export outer membrane protein [Roseateles saccharophilus]
MIRLHHLLIAAVLGLGGLGAQAQAGAAAGAAAAEYRLGAGDVVRVVVYQNPDLTLETRVSETGVISYPLLGNVRIGGLGVSAAEKLIADGLRNGNYVKQPQVTLVLLQVKGNQASVLGQVNRPGRFPIETADMRVTDLLANAGGVASTGGDQLVLTGMRDGKPLRLEIDLPSVFAANSDRAASDVLIQNGDVLWVDRAPIVYIYGEVQRPGPMRLERGMTLMQVLAAGGGLTQRGTERGIRVHRKSADGKVQVMQPAMDDGVKDGDVVYVKESLF